MPLQRYWIGNDEGTGFPVSRDDEGEWVKASEAEAEIAALKKRIGELESRLEPCEVCNDIDCEDASKEYYIKRWKEAEKRAQELEELLALAGVKQWEPQQ